MKKKNPRRILYLVLNLTVIITLTLVLVDTVLAARAEYRISQRIYSQSNLATPPRVQLIGFPFLRAATTHELQSVTIEANDIDLDNFGLISVRSSAQYVTLSTKDLFLGEITDAPARKVFTRIQLDPVAIGNRLSMNDLQISNLNDMSPRGGWETEALFEGTVAGFSKPASVEIALRIRAGNIHLIPIRVIEGPDALGPDSSLKPGEELPEDIRSRILGSFGLNFLGKDLPMRWRPSRIYTSGGSVYIEAEQFYTRISLNDLAPRSRTLSEEEKPRL